MAADKQSPSRNVIIIGDKGCGKSTIVSKIDHGIYPSWTDLNQVCHTVGPIRLKNAHDINVIDTICFRSPQFTESIESFFAKSSIDHINLIIVVIRADRITAEEREVLESIIFSFDEDTLRKTLAFILSHCENYDYDERKSIIDTFKNDIYFSKFTNFVSVPEKRILTTGFPSAKEYKAPVFKCFEDGIRKDVEQLCELIISATESVGVKSIFKNPKANNSLQIETKDDEQLLEKIISATKSVGGNSLSKNPEANNSHQIETKDDEQLLEPIISATESVDVNSSFKNLEANNSHTRKATVDYPHHRRRKCLIL